ncbi:hypothetical protein D3C81_1608880 [compost metagenome]
MKEGKTIGTETRGIYNISLHFGCIELVYTSLYLLEETLLYKYREIVHVVYINFLDLLLWLCL